jgi:hypothetical protein
MPRYQLAKGCLVDQLVGQYMAHVCGLGYLGREANIKATLQSILKYNSRETMENHFNNMRSYALGKESALLMASWPNGRPSVPFPYFSEVMTGFEYAAAVGMLYEGMNVEGIKVIKNIRNRYDGAKRSPFDEAECGHHYARAMASWAANLALSGFHFSAIDQSIHFTSTPGTWFWSNGYAWGVAKTDSSGVEISVKHGQLSLRELGLGLKQIKLRKGVVIDSGQSQFFAL